MSFFKKNIVIVSSIVLSAFLGFFTQKLIVIILSVEDFARYDLALSVVGVFNGMLTVGFINYYKKRSIKSSSKYHSLLNPYHFLILCSNAMVTGLGILVISIFYPLSMLSVLSLTLIHLSFLLFEFKKTSLNLTGRYQLYALYNVIPSSFFLVFLLLISYVFKYVHQEVVLLSLALAYGVVILSIAPKIYRLSFGRIKKLFCTGRKFLIPIFLYSILSWANENLGKFYLKAHGVGLFEIGQYIAIYALVSKIVFTSAVGFNYVITEKLFQKRLDKTSILNILFLYLIFSFAILAIFSFFPKMIIKLFLSENYVLYSSLCVYISFAALTIKAIHMVENYFVRIGKTQYSLYGFIVLIVSYLFFLYIKKDQTIVWICQSQVYASIISLLFVVGIGAYKTVQEKNFRKQS